MFLTLFQDRKRRLKNFFFYTSYKYRSDGWKFFSFPLFSPTLFLFYFTSHWMDQEKFGEKISSSSSANYAAGKDLRRRSMTSIESAPSPVGSSLRSVTSGVAEQVPEPHMGLLSSCNMVRPIKARWSRFWRFFPRYRLWGWLLVVVSSPPLGQWLLK
jgi:hypothetical protein